MAKKAKKKKSAVSKLYAKAKKMVTPQKKKAKKAKKKKAKKAKR
jgi:hypothetical protein